MTADLSTPPLSLSVVIPARDAAELIDGCLEALLAQDVELEFDVIVATGPSGDDTAARVDAWAVRDMHLDSEQSAVLAQIEEGGFQMLERRKRVNKQRMTILQMIFRRRSK